MKYTNVQLLNIPVILEKFTRSYMRFHNHSVPRSINNGECFVWAWGVYIFLKRYGISSNLVSCVSHGGHAWIEINGIAYDSEHVYGTDSVLLACEFANETDSNYIDYYSMDEEEFFEHWMDNGWRRDMLSNDGVFKRLNRSLSQLVRNNKIV